MILKMLIGMFSLVAFCFNAVAGELFFSVPVKLNNLDLQVNRIQVYCGIGSQEWSPADAQAVLSEQTPHRYKMSYTEIAVKQAVQQGNANIKRVDSRAFIKVALPQGKPEPKKAICTFVLCGVGWCSPPNLSSNRSALRYDLSAPFRSVSTKQFK